MCLYSWLMKPNLNAELNLNKQIVICWFGWFCITWKYWGCCWGCCWINPRSGLVASVYLCTVNKCFSVAVCARLYFLFADDTVLFSTSIQPWIHPCVLRAFVKMRLTNSINNHLLLLNLLYLPSFFCQLNVSPRMLMRTKTELPWAGKIEFAFIRRPETSHQCQSTLCDSVTARCV